MTPPTLEQLRTAYKSAGSPQDCPPEGWPRIFGSYRENGALAIGVVAGCSYANAAAVTYGILNPNATQAEMLAWAADQYQTAAVNPDAWTAAYVAAENTELTTYVTVKIRVNQSGKPVPPTAPYGLGPDHWNRVEWMRLNSSNPLVAWAV